MLRLQLTLREVLRLRHALRYRNCDLRVVPTDYLLVQFQVLVMSWPLLLLPFGLAGRRLDLFVRGLVQVEQYLLLDESLLTLISNLLIQFIALVEDLARVVRCVHLRFKCLLFPS